jgi:hypothetical protein
MPGKYPTIEAPITSRSSISPGATPDVEHTAYSLSNSDTSTLRSIFPNSPIYSITAEQLRQRAQRLLLDGTVTGDDAVGTVDRDFSDAPNINDVVTGGGGLPASPYYPNLASATNPADPSTQPEPPAGGYGITANDNFGTGTGLANPSEAAALIGQTSIEVVGPIANKGQSAAHGLNPGASS